MESRLSLIDFFLIALFSPLWVFAIFSARLMTKNFSLKNLFDFYDTQTRVNQTQKTLSKCFFKTRVKKLIFGHFFCDFGNF